MTKLSLREAAKLCGRGKSTIQAAIKDGRLSADRGEAGAYEIDPSELHRVFPFSMDTETGQATIHRTEPDAETQDSKPRPAVSEALNRPSSRTGRAGGALATAENELRDALAEIERLKLDGVRARAEIEKDARHAAELSAKEIEVLRRELDMAETSKADLKEAHEAHLRDLRRELEQMRALLPPPDAGQGDDQEQKDPAPRRGLWSRLTGR